MTEALRLNARDAKAKSGGQDSFIEAYRWMVLGRVFEDKIASLYRAGKIVGGVYLGRGQEAFSTALASQLREGDIYSPLIRDLSGRLAFGESVLDSMRTYLGSVEGPMRGRDGNIHYGRPLAGMPAMISHLGAMVPVVSGMLMARRITGRLGDAVGAVTMGDGGTSTGAFHEGLNMAAVERLPLVVSVANNQFAYSTPTSRQYACADLVDRARGYGIEGYSVDALNLREALDTFRNAIDRARSGHGPQMVVGTLLRLNGHGEHDDAAYVPDELRNSRLGQDCLILARKQLIENGWLDETKCETIDAEAIRKVAEALSIAQREHTPDPYAENWEALHTRHLVEGSHTTTP